MLLLALGGGTIPLDAQQVPKDLNIQRFPPNTDTDKFQRNFQQQPQPLLENKLGNGSSENYHTCPKGTHEVAQQLPELPGEVRAVDGVEFSPDGSKMRFTYNGKSCSK